MIISSRIKLSGISTAALFLVLLFACFDSASARDISTLYKDAMDSFYKKDYKTAISIWQDILKADPGQKNPSKLIEMARSRIADENKSEINSYDRFLAAGDYKNALLSVGRMLNSDPNNPGWLSIKAKLEKFSKEAAPSITANGKIPELLRKSVSGYLGYEKDGRIPVHASRYAWQLDKTDRVVENVFLFMEKEFSETAHLEVIDPAKTVVDQKLEIALDAIYGGKYGLAAAECEVVITLELDNVVAWKRLGSAYYALGQTGQARYAWEKALKLVPDDQEIKKFLTKVK